MTICRALGQDGDLGGEGFHFLVPILPQRPLEAGHQNLALGNLDQSHEYEKSSAGNSYHYPFKSYSLAPILIPATGRAGSSLFSVPLLVQILFSRANSGLGQWPRPVLRGKKRF